MNFQPPATPIMEGIVDLHHDIMFVVIFISVFVCFTTRGGTIKNRTKELASKPVTVTVACFSC